jgi:hypothetical protein
MIVPSQIIVTSPLLNSLEDLGALSSSYGLIDIKPFKDWIGSKWCERIFTFRLCNTGEVFDIATDLGEYSADAKEIKLKHELIVRSVYAIDGNKLVKPEEVDIYNQQHNTNLSEHQFLLLWVRNLEKIVVNRLDAVYSALEFKQMRLLRGVKICAECNREFVSYPPKAKILNYSLAEILCPECLTTKSIDLSLYDICQTENQIGKDTPSVNNKDTKLSDIASVPDSEEDEGYKCECGEEFDELESYISHRNSCPKAERE